MTGSVLGFAAAALLAVAGIRWLRLMREVRIPQRITPYLLATGAAAQGPGTSALRL